jgi:hypothetical protein
LSKSLNDSNSVSNRIQEYDLIDALLMPYRYLINTCIMSDLVLGPIDAKYMSPSISFSVIKISYQSILPDIVLSLFCS